MIHSYLIIDIGTGNARVALIAQNGKVLAVQTKDTVYNRDSSYTDGWSFEPMLLWKNICSMISGVLSALPPDAPLAAITATSAREGIVLMDQHGQSFLGLPNIDNRGLDYQCEIPNPTEIYRKSGHWLSPCFSALKLVGLRKKHPQLYDRIRKITSISDWIGFQFTGNCVYEYSQACETQLMDIETLEWSQSLCDTFHISSSILPPLVSSGTRLGTVLPDISQKLGIPQGIPFIVSSADTQTAVAGVNSHIGDMVLVSGTTSPIVRIVDAPLYDPQQRCWIDCHIHKHEYLLESNAGITGLNYQRLKSVFFSDISYEEMEQKMLAKHVPQVTASLGTLIFSQSRSLLNAGFQFHAPIAADLDRFDFALAVAHDIVFSIFSNFRNQNDILPFTGSKIIGCGGGLRSSVICQALADLTRMQIVLPDGFTQASALGCAATCAAALNLSLPFSDQEKIYFPQNNPSNLLDEFNNWIFYREHINQPLIS